MAHARASLWSVLRPANAGAQTYFEPEQTQRFARFPAEFVVTELTGRHYIYVDERSNGDATNQLGTSPDGIPEEVRETDVLRLPSAL
ncbi:MAG: hypothetical protein IV094_07030 [Vitreoscilla sp.]|nr:hypothetical protein [Vitreoscilla sp.]